LAVVLAAEMATDRALFDAVSTDLRLAAAIDPDHAGARGFTSVLVGAFVARVVAATLRRRREGTDHGLHATTVEELLRATRLSEPVRELWTKMKATAAGIWASSKAGGDLLTALEAWQAEAPRRSLDLVGHSAGGVVICEMLAAIRARDLPIAIDNIILLAPACRLERLASDIIRNPKSSSGFRLFTMDDEHERADRLAPLIYPHSLLYLVSGVLEVEPDAALAGLERHLRAAGPTAGVDFDDCRRWLGLDQRLIYAPTASGGTARLACGAFRHGDFDTDPQILNGLVAMAGDGA
jgi:hypothetical protein